ncbi:cytochrome P450 [Aspergillus aurantiobrunneus]
MPGLLAVGFIAILCFFVYHHRKNKGRLPLPPGPSSLPILGNVLDLPPPESPSFSAGSNTETPTAAYHPPSWARKHRRLPQLNFATPCGFEVFLTAHQYNATYQHQRRLLHGQIGTRALSERFNGVQEEDVLFFLLMVLREPDGLAEHLKTVVAAIILKITYGYSVDRDNVDPLVELVEHAMEHLSLAFVPCSWLVHAVPAVDRLPDGFPGTSYKRTAREWRAVNDAAAEIPYAFGRQQMSKGVHRRSYVSSLLEQSIASPGSTPEDEHAIKWTALSLYAAGSETTAGILTSVILVLNLPYIDGIVKEACRWNPVGPMGLAHKSEEDIWFLRDPKAYSDPKAFKPERYMAPLNEPDSNDIAFGYGRRACTGRYFADNSVFRAVVQMLSGFRISKARDERGDEIDVKVEAAPGVINRPKKFAFQIESRSQLHTARLRRLEGEGEREVEVSDAGCLNVGR